MNNAKAIAEKILNCKTYDIPDIQELASAYLELENRYKMAKERIERDQHRISEITKLKKSREVLRKAVEFYGNNSTSVWTHDGEIELEIDSKKAREAIKADDDIMGGN